MLSLSAKQKLADRNLAVVTSNVGTSAFDARLKAFFADGRL